MVSPIPIPFMAAVVTARVGHIPKTSTKVGFSLMIPLYKRSTGVFAFILFSLLYIIEGTQTGVYTASNGI